MNGSPGPAADTHCPALAATVPWDMWKQSRVELNHAGLRGHSARSILCALYLSIIIDYWNKGWVGLGRQSDYVPQSSLCLWQLDRSPPPPAFRPFRFPSNRSIKYSDLRSLTFYTVRMMDIQKWSNPWAPTPSRLPTAQCSPALLSRNAHSHSSNHPCFNLLFISKIDKGLANSSLK